MDDKKARELLQQIHDEINNIQKVDKEESELLKDLDGDIRALLERSGEQPVEVHPSIVQNLENTLSHYEFTHLELTTLISKLLDILSTAGV
jgi:Domain of unknown function (DUF4404)